MIRLTLSGLLMASASICSAGAEEAATAAIPLEEVTYANTVAHTIQEKCQQCHRPGAVAPFALMDYRDAKGWAKMIKEVVTEGRMPPWHADAPHGHFRNDRRLTDTQKEQLIHWIDNGMPRGEKADMPEPIDYSAQGEWQFGEPDLVFELPEEVTVPATGVVPYMYFESEMNLESDVYVHAAEAKPGNPAVVHHIIAQWELDAGVNPDWDGPREGTIAMQAPGDIPFEASPGTARIIPKGAHIQWQMHYTPSGKEETDRSRLALWLDEEPPQYVVQGEAPMTHNFRIPPHAENHPVEATETVWGDWYVLSFMPHMHVRGKSFKYTAIYPDGKEEVLLNVPEYDFNWQSQYRLAEPKLLPKGTTIKCEATYDNSANNPYNPDPDSAVFWGDQTWEEMMIGFITYYEKDPGANAGARDTD